MFFIDKNSSKPYYEQIILSVKEAVVQQALRPGDRLPSVRELAAQLMMNPNTISKAYKALESQDVIVTVKGKGTFIKAVEEAFRDERQIQKLKTELENLAVEASYLKVGLPEIQGWLAESYQKIGGEQGGNQ